MASKQRDVVDPLPPLPTPQTHLSNDGQCELWTDQPSIGQAERSGRWLITRHVVKLDGSNR